MIYRATGIASERGNKEAIFRKMFLLVIHNKSLGYTCVTFDRLHTYTTRPVSARDVNVRTVYLRCAPSTGVKLRR